MGSKTEIHVLLSILLVLLLGCATEPPAREQAFVGQRITNLSISKSPVAMALAIEGNPAMNHTVEKVDFPMGIVMLFPDTHLALAERIYVPVENDIISSIKVDEKLEDKRTTARIFIALKKDAPYVLSADTGGLVVSFPLTGTATTAALTPAEPPSKNGPAPKTTSEQKPESVVKVNGSPAAGKLIAVTPRPHEDRITIDVQADGTITDYKSFILTSPPRIVFDLYNVKSPYKKEQKQTVTSKWVKRIRHFGYPDKVRLVIETHQAYLKQYSAVPYDAGLVIQVGNAQAAPQSTETLKSDAPSGTRQIKLTWEPVPGADSYNVYWRTYPGVTRRNGNKIANVQIPVTIKNLKAGATYYFVVTAVKGSQESQASEEFSHTISK